MSSQPPGCEAAGFRDFRANGIRASGFRSAQNQGGGRDSNPRPPGHNPGLYQLSYRHRGGDRIARCLAPPSSGTSTTSLGDRVPEP